LYFISASLSGATRVQTGYSMEIYLEILILYAQPV
jgi:hypothetical protein